jgi:type IV fimbrial biogenesis protein FimT
MSIPIVPLQSEQQRGFTLVELVVTLAVVGVLAGIAAPSLATLIASQRVRTLASDLHLAMTQTRSEAIKRNAPVTLSATGGNWASGWTVLDPANPTGTPLYARTSRSLGTAVVTSAVTQVVYMPSGRITASTAPSFVFTATDVSDVRCVSVDPTGRPYTNKASSC